MEINANGVTQRSNCICIYSYSWVARDVTKKLTIKLKSLSSLYLDQLQEVLKIYVFACFQLGTVLRFENRAVRISEFFTVRDMLTTFEKHASCIKKSISLAFFWPKQPIY